MLGTDKEPGIYVRTLNDLFRAIEETSDDMLYSVSMSYLEVRLLILYKNLSLDLCFYHEYTSNVTDIPLIAHSV